jgi:hypothetical protein
MVPPSKVGKDILDLAHHCGVGWDHVRVYLSFNVEVTE